MIENKQQVGMTATFSRTENKQKYSKSTYVPPHQRNKPTQKSFDQKFTNGGNKKSLDYNNSYKPRGSTFRTRGIIEEIMDRLFYMPLIGRVTYTLFGLVFKKIFLEF